MSDTPDTTSYDALAKGVHDLTEAVVGMREGMVDKETVETLQAEVLQLQKGFKPERSGYMPEDEAADDDDTPEAKHVRDIKRQVEAEVARTVVRGKGAAKIEAVLSCPAVKVAELLGKSVEDIEYLQETSDDLLLLSQVLNRDPLETDFYGSEFQPALKAAMDTATVAEGKEFVPTTLSSNLIERVNLELMVAGLFENITMPRSPFEIPGFAVGRVRGGRHSEQTADTGQTAIRKITPGTRKITLTAQKFAAEVLVSKEEEEESIIPILSFIQDEIVDYISADIEDTIVNGDTTGAHQDSDVTLADDPRKSWMGLRKLAIAGAKADAANAALTEVMLRTNRKNMGKYGVRASRLVHIVGIVNYVQLLGSTNVVTVDKYGPNATILTGELAKVDGVPIVVSEYVRENLNATGVFDNVTTNRSVAITVNTKGYLLGSRRSMTIERLVELYSEFDQDAIKATTRKAFEPRFPAATEKLVALTYNTLGV